MRFALFEKSIAKTFIQKIFMPLRTVLVLM